MKVPRLYLDVLTELHQAGGAGTLDLHGIIWAGEPKGRMPGDPLIWMMLVSHGMVAGEAGKIIVTEAGRVAAEATLAGRVRTSA